MTTKTSPDQAENAAERFILEQKAPPCAETLGWSLKKIDPDAQTIELGFVGKPEFTNPMGMIQGGFVSAMLDDAMGVLLYILSNGTVFGSTINLNVQFLRPVPPGDIHATGRIVQQGRRVAYLEGELFDAKGKLCARATASAALQRGGE